MHLQIQVVLVDVVWVELVDHTAALRYEPYLSGHQMQPSKGKTQL